MRGKSFGPQVDECIQLDLEGVIVTPADKAQWRLPNHLAHEAKALPRIFLQIADAFLDFGRRHDFDCLEACVIQDWCNRQHLMGANSHRPQRLRSIAKRRVDKFQFSHCTVLTKLASYAPEIGIIR